ncbi:hypothetical protein MED121_16089 [Marinomonas sp. MED121]|uniref:hypothetical protein n=1 Tax=Marinomonas sp. MED121 TaxID=314277 RepID=UPI0000691080|nr:hypothetical protein [Marinomonas sp. MED121]EAQ67463.1 hypothetical protein MED121_16089 [Marinomonas sp. MED121]
MKKILVFGLMALTSIFTWASDNNSKYQRGDCITPIKASYSWYGKYALVEAYSAIEGFTKAKSYILAFPQNGSNSVIFSKKIENATKKVEIKLCGK